MPLYCLKKFSITPFKAGIINLINNEHFVINVLFVDTEGDTSETTWIGKLAVNSHHVNISNTVVFDSVNQEVVVVGKRNL